MKKDNDSPAISLFSFQDIITSITGIMFLVVLLLILLIFESKPEENSTPQPADQADREIAVQIAELEKKLAEFHERDAQLKKQLEEYRKMPAEQIQQRKYELEDALMRLRQSIMDLKTAEVREQKREKQFISHQQQFREKEKDLEAKMKEEQQQTTKRQEELKQLQQRLKTLRNTVKFSVENNSKLKPLLAEFSADGVRILDVITQKKYDLRRKRATPKEHIQQLKIWLGSRDRNAESLSVILGPSCLKYWNEIDRMLLELRFPHGLEIYSTDESSIFEGGEDETQP